MHLAMHDRAGTLASLQYIYIYIYIYWAGRLADDVPLMCFLL